MIWRRTWRCSACTRHRDGAGACTPARGPDTQRGGRYKLYGHLFKADVTKTILLMALMRMPQPDYLLGLHLLTEDMLQDDLVRHVRVAPEARPRC